MINERRFGQANILVFALSFLLCSSCSTNYFLKANQVRIIHLGSDTAWSLSINNGISWKPVIVPGGGCNSDLQTNLVREIEIDTNDMIYRRSITIPNIQTGQVSKIMFGAVNFGAEVFIGGDNKSGHLVATHEGVNMPFEADLTPYITPGKTYDLYVYAHPKDSYKIDSLANCRSNQRSVPVGFSFGPSYCDTRFGNMKFAYGIAKYINLQINNPVYIKDVFIRPVVNEQIPDSSSLYYDIWIDNRSSEQKNITITSDIKKWGKNPDRWDYPIISDQKITLAANSKNKVIIGPVLWKLGTKSFWWPNIPFVESYMAKLHYLNISIKEKRTIHDFRTQRFGFCTYTEGSHFYKINGKRFISIADGTPESGMSFYDCYSTSEAWTTGCEETLKRYMRLGFNTNRICQATATETMMNAADETGFMFIGESSIYGGENNYWYDNYAIHIKELARIYRNHPSTARYILANEVTEWTALIDSIVTEDNTRPLTFETLNRPYGKITSGPYHAYRMNHYNKTFSERDTTLIRGIGEIAWGGYDTSDSAAVFYFSNIARKIRMLDFAHVAPWDLLNYWPNFLKGMNHSLHCWIFNNHPDRDDDPSEGGVLGSEITYMKKSLEPFAIFDRSNEFNKQKGNTVPVQIDNYIEGSNVSRSIEIFNGGIESITSDKMKLNWEVRWDSETGPLALSGSTGIFTLTAGWHITKVISLNAPSPESTDRKLYLILKSYNNEQLVNTMEEYYITISQ
jgi:hypothetical protein